MAQHCRLDCESPQVSWVKKSFAFGTLWMFLFIMHVSESPLSPKKKKKQFNPEGLGNKQTYANVLLQEKSEKKRPQK